MAITRPISSPASWTGGTILTPTWAEAVDDTLNVTNVHSPGRFYLMDDFYHQGAAITAVSSTLGNWSCDTDSNVRFALTSGGSGAFGELACQMETDATGNGRIIAPALSGLGTGDFIMTVRVKLNDKAKLNTAANYGFSTGIRDWGGGGSTEVLLIGGSDANWYSRIAGTDTDLGVVSGTSYAKFKFVRTSGSVSVYVNDSASAAATVAQNNDLSANTPTIRLNVTTNGGSTNYTFATVDYFHFECGRT